MYVIFSFFHFQDEKMLTLPSFQSAFARTRHDSDDSFNIVEKNIINHGLKPSASLFSPVAVTGIKKTFHQLFLKSF
jgi:hypothetical protein